MRLGLLNSVACFIIGILIGRTQDACITSDHLFFKRINFRISVRLSLFNYSINLLFDNIHSLRLSIQSGEEIRNIIKNTIHFRTKFFDRSIQESDRVSCSSNDLCVICGLDFKCNNSIIETINEIGDRGYRSLQSTNFLFSKMNTIS